MINAWGQFLYLKSGKTPTFDFIFDRAESKIEMKILHTLIKNFGGSA